MKTHNIYPLQIEEYLNLEQTTGTRYEYHDGAVFAMAGGTLAHGFLCGNMFGELRAALRAKGSNYRPVNSEIKLHVEGTRSFLYPDTMVVCGEVEASSALGSK